MKKQNLLTILLTLNMFLLFSPTTSQARTIESNNILLCDARPAPVTLLTGNTSTGEITGSGQPGATIKVYLGNKDYTTEVDENGCWFVIADPSPKAGDEITATQDDKVGYTSSYTGILEKTTINIKPLAKNNIIQTVFNQWKKLYA